MEDANEKPVKSALVLRVRKEMKQLRKLVLGELPRLAFDLQLTHIGP